MKFIKYAMGLVIALSVIPLVVSTVNNLDTPKLKTIEFEVINDDGGFITFSNNTYNDIHSLEILDDIDGGTVVSNLLMVTMNDVELIDPYMWYNDEYMFFLSDGGSYDWTGLLTYDNTVVSEGYTPTIGDTWTMTFDVSKPLPPLVKLLVGFVPLILVGGILLFMLNKRKKEE